MPDITMCDGVDCKAKEMCVRFMSTPGKRQSWFIEVPGKDKECEYYVPVKKVKTGV